MAKRCVDCREGEHDNYTDDVRLVAIIEPKTGNRVRRAWTCSEHITAYLDDGYEIKESRK